MPRKSRHFLANVPCQIISRDNNHNVCFFVDAVYLFYLECLNDACQKHSVLMHAYVLMTNHVYTHKSHKKSRNDHAYVKGVLLGFIPISLIKFSTLYVGKIDNNKAFILVTSCSNYKKITKLLVISTSRNDHLVCEIGIIV
jgi:hypothetical protein